MYVIVTFKRWADEYTYFPRFLWCFFLMLLELSFENVMVWWVKRFRWYRLDLNYFL